MGLFVVYRLLKLFYVGCKCREFDMVPKLAASFDVHGLQMLLHGSPGTVWKHKHSASE